VQRRGDERFLNVSIAKHASDIANGIEGESPPPGLTSVATATATPASISCRAGA
jgi:hypothetical protein